MFPVLHSTISKGCLALLIAVFFVFVSTDKDKKSKYKQIGPYKTKKVLYSKALLVCKMDLSSSQPATIFAPLFFEAYYFLRSSAH